MILELIRRFRQGLEVVGRSPLDYILVLPPDLFEQLRKRVTGGAAYRFIPPHTWYGELINVAGLLVREGTCIKLEEVE